MSEIKGMIFAAGIGSRLKPWTQNHPKALVPVVADEPALAAVINKMIDTGIHDIIINVHHFADQIVDFIASRKWDAHIHISDETEKLLDTGGGLRKALHLIGDSPVLVHNADIASTLDLEDFIDTWRRFGSDALLLGAERATQRYFLFEDLRLRGWTNIATGQLRPEGLEHADGMQRLAFGGVHLISPSVFNDLNNYAGDEEPFSITDFYIQKSDCLDIRAYRMPQNVSWFDVGKPETLEKARSFFNKP